MSAKPYNHRAVRPVPDFTITTALRVTAEEVGSLLKKIYQASCAKLHCCSTAIASDEEDERQKLIQDYRQKDSRYRRGAGSDRDSASTKTRTTAASSSSIGRMNSTITTYGTNGQESDDDVDDDKVPLEFQIMSPKTPPTPPDWNKQNGKLLVGSDIIKDQNLSAKIKPECWPPSYPGVERSNFGARFYNSP